MGLEAGGLSNLFLAAQGVNAAAGLADTYQQVQAQRAQGSYAKQTANDQAAMAELQAKDADRAGDRAAALRGLETRDLIARQRAAAAGQGIETNAGSILNLTGDTAAMGALDVEMEKNNAWRQVFGLKSEAENLRTSGKNAKASANAKARMTAASGGLQFGRDVMSAGYQYGKFRDGPKVNKKDQPATYYRAKGRK